MPDPRIEEGEFRRRFLEQYQDPAFDRHMGYLQPWAAEAPDETLRSPRQK